MMRILAEATVAGVPESVNHIWRSSRGRFYKTTKAKDFEELLVRVLHDSYKKNFKGPYKCDVILDIIIERKTRRKWDLDNRIKSIQDCLAPAGIIENDCQVKTIRADKEEAETDRTTVRVLEYEEWR